MILSLDAVKIVGSLKARFVIKKDIVNPIPANPDTQKINFQFKLTGNELNPTFTAM